MFSMMWVEFSCWWWRWQLVVMAVADRGAVVTLELVSAEQREEHANQIDAHSGSAHRTNNG